MTTFRFMHCGDAHIGSGYAQGDEGEGGNTRLVDFRDAWVRLCQTAVDRKVDVVLFGGDAFRDSKPSPAEKDAFAAGLQILAAAGIPFFAAEGNHDKSKSPSKPSALAIFDAFQGADVRVFARPAVIPPGEFPVAIAVLPYVARGHVSAADPEFAKLSMDEQSMRISALTLDALRGLSAEAESFHPPLGSILVAHGTIAGSKLGAEASTAFLREAVLPASELRGMGFRYQAFAHLHRAQTISEGIAYSGSIERTDFAEADEDKGAWIVTLTEDHMETEWVSSMPRPFVDVDLGDGTDWEGQLDALPEILTMDAVVRVTYETTPEVAKTVDHAAIRRALYAAGAVKVHGPIANIIHNVTEASDAVTEETDMMTGWSMYADLQGLSGPQRERLDRKVGDALEAICQA